MDANRYAYNRTEAKIIEKLNTLTNPETFFEDVRKFTKNIHSDRLINIWECFSEIRHAEITGKEIETE